MNEATRILAIRHGQTAWNADGRIQGQLDIGLDATGRAQAQALAQALDGEPIDALYSSDLSRARQTAAPLARRAGLVLRVDAGLRERGFGEFEGLSFAEVSERWPAQAERWRKRDPAFGPTGGEVLSDFRDRVIEVMDRLARAHPGRQIAVVTHGGVLDQLYRAATRLALDAPRAWPVANAAINRLLYADQGLSLVGWADVAHLAESPAG